MLIPDFSNQQYIAEVLRVSDGSTAAPAAIERLLIGKWERDSATGSDGRDITLHHGFVASPLPYHRTTRTITDADGEERQIPRTKLIRSREHFLYDVFLVQRDRHLVIAVPFHGLATGLFLKVDRQLAGTGVLYETLNLTNMVIRLGATGRAAMSSEADDSAIVVTRCHLAYSDPKERRRDVEQVRLSGANLGASTIYADLVGPVLHPKSSRLTVTPIVLGSALYSGGVRRTSATTDRHGNFKLTVGPGLRQISRMFQLLDAIEEMQNVVSTTSNIPILQSQSIEGSD